LVWPRFELVQNAEYCEGLADEEELPLQMMVATRLSVSSEP
jgi:hypothetical protein